MIQEVNALTEGIIGAAIEVHRHLGPGLLESAYQACLAHELRERVFEIEEQKEVPVIYKGVHLDCGYRLDILVRNTVIIELKSVDKLEPIHEAQLISYLRLSGHHVGLLINFNVTQLVKGIKRRVLDLPELPDTTEPDTDSF
jgi:GxxExxY protein